MRPAKAVILGRTGFLGRAVGDALAREGLAVSGYSSATLDLARFESLSALDGALDERTALVMASGLTLDRAPDTLETFGRNLAMTTNLARYLETRRLGSCVYLSSFTVYGDAAAAPCVDESTAVAPETLYAAAKFAGERQLALAAGKAGFPLLNLRLARVYGPGARHAAYGPDAFVRSIRERGEVRLYGDGEESRDHLFIDDAATLVARLVRDGRDGVFNVASGESRTYRQVVAALAKVSPRPFAVVTVPRTRPATDLAPFRLTKLESAAPLARTSLEDGLLRTFNG